MAICDAKEERNIKKSHQDLNFFTDSYKGVIDKKNYLVLAEDLDMYNKLFTSDKGFNSSFQKLQDSLIWLCISDKKTHKITDTFIIIAFKYPTSEEQVKEQYQFIHDLVLKVSLLRVLNPVSF